MESSEQNLSDEVLVVAAIMGDLRAFDALVARYRVAAVRLAEGIVGYQYGEDVAQDALLLAFQALPSIEDPSCFGIWLKRITRNRALRFKSTRQISKGFYEETDEVLLQQLPALTRPLAEVERDAKVREALGKLPDDFALPIRLHYFDELPLKRVAAFLGVPESTIKWRLYKGRLLLRQHLQSERRFTWNANKN